jgi:hypothetical protein
MVTGLLPEALVGFEWSKAAGKRSSVPRAAARAALGMLDVDGRDVTRGGGRGDTLILTIPLPLFRCLEREAGNSVLQTPRGRSSGPAIFNLDQQTGGKAYASQRPWRPDHRLRNRRP